MGAAVKRLTGARLIFDIRGFMAEEYVDAGDLARGGPPLPPDQGRRSAACSKASDGFVVLTERAREVLFPGCTDTDPRGRPIEVIPCCVDLRRFRGGRRGHPRRGPGGTRGRAAAGSSSTPAAWAAGT